MESLLKWMQIEELVRRKPRFDEGTKNGKVYISRKYTADRLQLA
jgi:hypothetical protein